MHQNILYSNSRARSIKTRIGTWIRVQRKYTPCTDEI